MRYFGIALFVGMVALTGTRLVAPPKAPVASATPSLSCAQAEALVRIGGVETCLPTS